MAWLLGANWQSSLSGYVTMGALAIHEKPVLIQWIPEPSRGFVWNFSEYIFFGGFILMANRMKDKGVTGGKRQQSLGGNLVELGKQNLVDATKAASPSDEKCLAPEAAKKSMPVDTDL